ncbi:MAG: hypothetical protein ACJ74O_19420 [Frankiaceae bacterium]
MPEPSERPRHDDVTGAGAGLSTDLEPRPAEGPDEVLSLVRRLTSGDDDAAEGGTRRTIIRLVGALAANARTAGLLAVAGGRWLADLVVDVAPQLQIRDLPTLQAAHEGRTGDALAEALVRTASRTTAAVGAAGGAIAAAEMVVPPTLLGIPLQLAAETLLVVAVELRLIGELHEVHGQPVAGSARQRATALVTAWARRRGVDPLGAGVAGALGIAARRELRARVLRRLGRNVTTLAPFLAGAVAGAELNRRETVALAERVLADLRAGRRG